MSSRVFDILDKRDPINSSSTITEADLDTIEQFIEVYPHLYWCPELASTVVLKDKVASYDEVDGDSIPFELFAKFNAERAKWVDEQIELAKLSGDKHWVAHALKYQKKVIKSMSSGAINSCVRLWKSLHSISATKLNTNPKLLGTPTGVFSLDTGLTTHAYADVLEMYEGYEDVERGENLYITKSTRGIFDFGEDNSVRPFKPDPRWQQFIDEIMCEDKEKAGYLQRALGYSMLGGNPAEVMFVAYGASTRNGKSTLLNAVAHALGDYARAASSEFLLQKNFASGNDLDEIARTQGVRLLTISEPPEGKKLDESKVKSFTGNDPIVASKKYGRTFSFVPQFTMWMMCNSLPDVKDTTVFTSGRLKVIPFDRHFAEDEQDTSLKEHFKTEWAMQTILQWLLKGYQEYQKRGLDEPASVKENSISWQIGLGDHFRYFIDTQCERVGEGKVKLSDFKEAYKQWCEVQGCEPLNNYQLGNKLKELNIPKVKINGPYYLQSISLK